MAKHSILKIENLSVSYGPVKAVRNVSLQVNEGEIVALIGANGAGKSTLLGAVLGLHHVDSGTILFMEEDITQKPTHRIVASGVSLIPEGHIIMPLMTVLENLQVGALHLKGDIDEYLERVFQQFPILRERCKQMAETLSGGEQQMLSIGRGLMSAPKLLMLDEPSLGLAPVVVEEIFEIVIELNKEGYSILLSEQNAHKALECAHHGCVFETGSIVLSGTAQELSVDPRVRAAYLGGG